MHGEDPDDFNAHWHAFEDRIARLSMAQAWADFIRAHPAFDAVPGGSLATVISHLDCLGKGHTFIERFAYALCPPDDSRLERFSISKEGCVVVGHAPVSYWELREVQSILMEFDTTSRYAVADICSIDPDLGRFALQVAHRAELEPEHIAVIAARHCFTEAMQSLELSFESIGVEDERPEQVFEQLVESQALLFVALEWLRRSDAIARSPDLEGLGHSVTGLQTWLSLHQSGGLQQAIARALERDAEARSERRHAEARAESERLAAEEAALASRERGEKVKRGLAEEKTRLRRAGKLTESDKHLEALLQALNTDEDMEVRRVCGYVAAEGRREVEERQLRSLFADFRARLVARSDQQWPHLFSDGVQAAATVLLPKLTPSSHGPSIKELSVCTAFADDAEQQMVSKWLDKYPRACALCLSDLLERPSRYEHYRVKAGHLVNS